MTIVPPKGPRDADIMIVGEAPGAQEVRDRAPFVGASGRLLHQVMASAGLPPSHSFITNVCQQRPPGSNIDKWVSIKTTKGVRESTRVQLNSKVAEGIRALWLDIAEVRPKIIVPLGNVALWALTGLTRIQKRRGSLLETTIDKNRIASLQSVMDEPMLDAIASCLGIRVIPTLHPAFVNRKFELLGVFQFDFKRIHEELTNPRGVPEAEYIIDPSPARRDELVGQLLQADVLCYDIEVIGGDRLYCVGFASEPSWALTLTANSYENRAAIEALLSSPAAKLAQNGIFDKTWLRRFEGLVVSGEQHDTLVVQAIVYPEYPKGLDFIGSIHTRHPYHKDEGKNWNPRDASDVQRFLEYNAKDVIVTLDAYLSMREDELKDEHHASTYRRIMKQQSVYEDMMHHGIKIDLAEMARLRNLYLKDAAELQHALDTHVGNVLVDLIRKLEEKNRIADANRLKGFLTEVLNGMGTEKGGLNVNSSKMLQFWLYDILGMPVQKSRTTKNPTTDETALKKLYAITNDTTLLTIWNIREKRKRVSSFLSINTADDGTCFFSVMPVKTKTGRSAMGKTILGEGLNMQTVPHELRSIFVPDEPSYEFAYLDLAQAEARIVAYYAGISRMIQAFETDEDLHRLTASLILDIPYDSVEEYPHRYLGKRCNHAFNYEMGPRKFYDIVNNDATDTGISVTYREAKSLREAHLRAYPELGFYWDSIREQLRKNRTLINPFGRKRVFPGRLDDATFREAFSHFAQSTVADVLRTGMVAAQDWLTANNLGRVVLEVHDAILIQYPRDQRDLVLPAVMSRMEIPLTVKGHEITIPVDAKHGPTWHDDALVKYVKEA